MSRMILLDLLVTLFKSSYSQNLNHSRRDISKLLLILTDHWLIVKYVSRFDPTLNVHRRNCKDIGKEETICHLKY